MVTVEILRHRKEETENEPSWLSLTVIKSSPMRPLPNPRNLNEAVRFVIESNRSDGYLPNRFIQATADGTAPNLLAVCINLISKGETLQYLESALRRLPTLLTLEDFVSHRGSEWGFDEATVEAACARSEYFDQIAGCVRYK